ncbi:hypothetical protein ACFYZB_12350 [Streptomyces sp. NPDC001852]|uniref:hypothetical protein n=1 Tax=Streptomyces sp. NPDC001852 TaxID=3364619 RepID=UPI003686378C
MGEDTVPPRRTAVLLQDHGVGYTTLGARAPGGTPPTPPSKWASARKSNST